MEKQQQPVYFGHTLDKTTHAAVEGGYVHLLGEDYYKITNYDAMPPFFMSIVSDSDHWLFISSTGGLTAGRINADSAIFPYYTEDKITENSEHTGSKTILLVKTEEQTFLWEPFSLRYPGVYRIQRNLYKNVYGNKLLFEEINHDLHLTFKYAWRTSDLYGFVRTSWLHNIGEMPCMATLLDGLQNILPYGANTALQGGLSVLLDAYKRNESEQTSGLGIFGLSSILTDLAEPSEALKATTVWQAGLEQEQYLLSSEQLDAFRHGFDITAETDLRGKRGAFLVHARIVLPSGAEKVWNVVADVNQDHTRIAALRNALKRSKADLCTQVYADIDQGTENLVNIIASADGLQLSADELSTAHHFANVLFNTMRGGIFVDNYTVPKDDLLDFVTVRNRLVLETNQEFFARLPEQIHIDDLLSQAVKTGAVDLERLCHEYLPLTFSRRHGDPSRPWNVFSINIKKEDGSKRLNYQGNWRDIFQNWEPLAYAFPEFVESMICKFLNATTAEGYNPYRVTRNGMEWESPEPDNPWANIGYWSDHQIIYLQKLMEVSEKFHPGELKTMLGRKMFSHANVPYKLKAYELLLEDWFATIEFDWESEGLIAERMRAIGTDGKLVCDTHGNVYHVTLTEKLLTLLLAKLVNFVPEGGIWMNTQRPEWNDANNALVGKGISMVTMYYLRRFIAFAIHLFTATDQADFPVTKEVIMLFERVKTTLERSQAILERSFSDVERRVIMDELGGAGSDYRLGYYQNGLSGLFESLKRDDIVAFLRIARCYVEHTIRANKRADGLYHAYNILRLGENKASVGYLYEMLEGQVAMLSSGMLAGQETLDMLQALRESKMYRADQHSYILYPERQLPGFLQKNAISAEQVEHSRLIAKLVAERDVTLMMRDEEHVYHFNGSFRNANDVKAALEKLAQQEEYAALVERETEMILVLFEKHFDHQSFTGRSGSFFAYEGLGSIYWHMVSKLLLAVQENYWWAHKHGESDRVLRKLADAYYDIRKGVGGFNKTPDVYGAFPTDPYSHTPAGQGARQPGMTGQVKEEILTRLNEMGVFIEQGIVCFQPLMLRSQEFLKTPQVFEYIDVAGQKQWLDLPAGSLAYTFCQVPVVYIASSAQKTAVTFSDGTILESQSNCLDAENCHHLFRRDGKIKQITVYGYADTLL